MNSAAGVHAAPTKAGLSTVSFRTHALLGAAAVFGAVLAQPSAVGSKHDPVVAGEACSPQRLPMLMGQGDVSFVGAMGFPGGSAKQSVALGDVDGDERLDVLVGNR